ncbi:MAG: DsrE family protein [bacterium]|nr:DsrE family protein [bacterium]
MAELLVVCACGLDNPNRASLAFLTAKGAKENKDNPTIFLANDGVIFAKNGIAQQETIQGVGLAAFSDVFEICQILKIPILVCKPCAEARGIKQDDLIDGARFSGIYDMAKLAARMNTVSF